MLNPFNPLNWVRTTQDWFTRAERSSGFRPYLIFLIITDGLSLLLLVAFRDVPDVRWVALLLLLSSFLGFVILFAVKAFQDPEFCRSETHVQQMRRLDIESMGSESESLPAIIIEEEESIEEPAEPRKLDRGLSDEAQ